MRLSSFLTRVSDAFSQASQFFTDAKGGQEGAPPFNSTITSDQARANYNALMPKDKQLNAVVTRMFQQQEPQQRLDPPPPRGGRTPRQNPRTMHGHQANPQRPQDVQDRQRRQNDQRAGTQSRPQHPRDVPAAQQRNVQGTQDEQSADHHYTVAAGINLSAGSEEVVRQIANEYYRKTEASIHVTSGTRTPASQAQAMYYKLSNGDSPGLYANQIAVNEIVQAYRGGVAAKKSRTDIIVDMTQVIENQVARDVYISRHLRAGAIDVRSNNMTPEQKRAFREAVATVSGVTVIEERIPPHFHLQH